MVRWSMESIKNINRSDYININPHAYQLIESFIITDHFDAALVLKFDYGQTFHNILLQFSNGMSKPRVPLCHFGVEIPLNEVY